MLYISIHLKINQLLICIYLLISGVGIYQWKLFYFLLVVFYLQWKLSVEIFLLSKFAKIVGYQRKIFNIITLIVQTTEIIVLFFLIWTSLVTFIRFQNTKSTLLSSINGWSFDNRHFYSDFFLTFYWILWCVQHIRIFFISSFTILDTFLFRIFFLRCLSFLSQFSFICLLLLFLLLFVYFIYCCLIICTIFIFCDLQIYCLILN